MVRLRRYLGDKFGPAMKYIWAIGLLAAGQSSTMTGTYTGQFVMSGFMDIQLSAWARAAITRSVALVPTLIVAVLFANTNRMDTLKQDLNVLQSFQLPFALAPVLYVSCRRDIMGSFRTKRVFKWVVFVVRAVLLAVNIVTAVVVVQGATSAVVGKVFIAFGLCLYLLFVVYLLIGPRRVHKLLACAERPGAWAAGGWLAQAEPVMRKRCCGGGGGGAAPAEVEVVDP
jgi:natural resistance-associated macrophage protein 2